MLAGPTPIRNSPHPANSDWDALQALETLEVPSPSPSFGTSTLYTGSGEIPIFLDTGNELSELEIEEDGSFVLLSSPHSPSSSSHSQEPLLGTPSIANLSPSISIHASPLSPQSSEYFGQPRITQTTARSNFSVSPYLASPSAPNDYRLAFSTDSRFTSPIGSPRITPAASTMTLPPVSAPATPFLSSASIYKLQQPTTPDSVAGNRTSLSPYSISPQSYQMKSSTSGYSSNTVSPSPSIVMTDMDESPLISRRHEPGWSTHGPSTFRLDNAATSTPLNMSPLNVRSGARSRTESMMTLNSVLSARSVHSPRSIRESSPLASSRIRNLPDSLEWLRNIKIELCIDQEGFRTARPCFGLTSFSNDSSDALSIGTNNIHTVATAEFRPLSKELYLFHYGAFDPPPILRRLTMAANESKDFISRHAILTLRANGVYAVNGTETLDYSPPNHQQVDRRGSSRDQSKLRWRFEYLVEDRRSETTGKVISGEKTLRPLNFTCSPGLLHPNQGKKIKFTQIFRKGLTPKLAAEKMEIPRPPRRDKPKFARDDSADKENIPPSPTLAAQGRQTTLPPPLKQRKVQSLFFPPSPSPSTHTINQTQIARSYRTVRQLKNTSIARSVSGGVSTGHEFSDMPEPAEPVSCEHAPQSEEEMLFTSQPRTGCSGSSAEDVGWLRGHGRHVNAHTLGPQIGKGKTISAPKFSSQRF